MRTLPTIDELVCTLKHSSLPTVFVEGVDDLKIYKHIESILGPIEVNVFPCGGRSRLLDLYKRKNEFGRINSIFIADSDLWIFSGIPSEYSEIVFTRGYSIENDIYSDVPERYFSSEEATQYQKILDIVCKWFSFAISKTLSNCPVEIATSVFKVVAEDLSGIRATLSNEIGYTESDSQLWLDIRENYRTKLRGKQLIDSVVYVLSAKTRAVKHGKDDVIEMCIKVEPSDSLKRIIREICSRLGVAVPIRFQ